MSYEWNNAYKFVMKIKKDYIDKFGKLDTYSVLDMCHKLNTKEYNNFLGCINITVFGTLNLFKYSLIKGGDIDLYTNINSIYREMRSLVINMKTDEIVLCPFHKFFNVNEIDETKIDIVLDKISHAKCVEIANKLDGSMQSASYYNGEIVMSGSQALDKDNSFRLAEGYSFLTDNHKTMIMENIGKTFIFEYVSLKDKHVVEYTKEQQGLYLIGIRDNNNGKQFSYNEVKSMANKYHVVMTEIETRTFAQIAKAVDDYKSTEKEGWVLFVDGYMYKMKCTDYLDIHKMLGSYSSANVIIRAIADEYYDDLISRIPTAYKDRINAIAKVVYDYIKSENEVINKYWESVPKNVSKKEQALFIKKHIPKQYQSYMFSKMNNYEYSVIKFKLHSATPQYIKMGDINKNYQTDTEDE